MTGSTSYLLTSTFKTWMSAKGIWIVFLAALVPLALNGAWVVTHRADVVATEVTWTPTSAEVGAPLEFVATIQNRGNLDVDSFNITMRVGAAEQEENASISFAEEVSNRTRVEGGLRAGQSTTARVRWTPSPGGGPFAQPDIGRFLVSAEADSGNEIPEIDEFNNFKRQDFQVQPGALGRDILPDITRNLTNANGTGGSVDFEVAQLTWNPSEIYPENVTTFRATVTNAGPDTGTATLTLRVGRYPTPTDVLQNETKEVTLAPGANDTIELAWTAGEGNRLYWVQAFANLTSGSDGDGADNQRSQVFVVLRPLVFPELPERATIKDFYLDILSFLYLPYLIPLVSLFYGAGVLSDERNRGNLTYILTRPVPRWSIPLGRFVSGFMVSGVAVTLGLVATFGLLFGTPDRDLGFLSTPILLALVSLFAYGALFTLIGVFVERAYLVGVAFIAWETVVLIGHRITVNNRPLIQDWVLNLTVVKHLGDAVAGWPFDQGFAAAPEGDALRALAYIVVGGVVALVVAVLGVKKREFDV